MNTKKLTQLAMLTGVALIIFVIELQILNPFPIPGVKLGSANIITVYAVYRYRAKEVMMIVFCRFCLCQAALQERLPEAVRSLSFIGWQGLTFGRHWMVRNCRDF